MVNRSKRYVGTVGAILLALLGGVSPALAGGVQFDSGKQVDRQETYKSAQNISDVYATSAIYGKLQGDIPVDLYSFKPSKDGEQTVSLRIPMGSKASESYQPLLILMDPTNATESQPIDLPLPSDKYHAWLVKQPVESQADNGEINRRTVIEPFLLYQNYHVVAEQKLKLKKDQVYYLFVLDPNKQAIDYALQFGEGSNWGLKDVVQHFGSWMRVRSGIYAGTSPFVFNNVAWSLIFFLFGISVLLGILIIQGFLFLRSEVSKPAGYLMVKLQPFGRVIIWISLWFILMGGIMYFNTTGWAGIPFVLSLIFIPLIANLLWFTLTQSFAIGKLEVSSREATIPLALRKRLYVSHVLMLLTVVPSFALLALMLS